MNDHEVMRLTAENTALLNEITRLRRTLDYAHDLVDVFVAADAMFHFSDNHKLLKILLRDAKAWLEEHR